MKKYQQKGSAMIVALMVVLILSITTAGFMHVTSFSANQANRSFNKMRLFWAAESGADHALKWIQRLRGEYFVDPTKAITAKEHFNTTDSTKSFVLYGGSQPITVNMSLDYDDVKNEWSINSRAVQSDGEDVTVKLKAIKAVNPAKFGFGLTADTMRLANRFHSGDAFDCEFYSSGGLNFTPAKDLDSRPQFNSRVSLSKKSWAGHTASKSEGVHTANTYSNDLVEWMKDTPMYANCLNANRKGANSNYDADDNKRDFLTTMGKIFPKGIEIVDEMDASQGICLDWHELTTNPPANIKCYPVVNGNSPKSIVFRIEGGNTIAKIGNTDITMGAGTYNTILVSGTGEVSIKGTVSTDVCVATEKNDVLIDGDIKYSDINYNISNPNIADTTVYRRIQKSILNNQTNTPKFSILAGISKNAAIPQGSVNVESMATGTRFISASIYSPKGNIGCKDGNPLVKDDFITLFVGSVITNNRDGWHVDDFDFTPKFYDDQRYKKSTKLPLGYLNAAGTGYIDDQINIIEPGYVWDVQ